jgi:hypothetical protein
MSISPQQATEALLDIERAQRRAFVLRGYEVGAPHFLLWGAIWFVGYGLTEAFPARAGLYWIALSLGGVLGGYLLGKAAAARGLVSKDGWRYLAAVGSTVAFMLLTYAIMQPRDSAQLGAFPALLVSFLYVLAGIWKGARWTVVGIVVAGLTMAGYELLQEHFNLWMALVGGGALVSTGLWFRRV